MCFNSASSVLNAAGSLLGGGPSPFFGIPTLPSVPFAEQIFGETGRYLDPFGAFVGRALRGGPDPQTGGFPPQPSGYPENLPEPVPFNVQRPPTLLGQKREFREAEGRFPTREELDVIRGDVRDAPWPGQQIRDHFSNAERYFADLLSGVQTGGIPVWWAHTLANQVPVPSGYRLHFNPATGAGRFIQLPTEPRSPEEIAAHRAKMEAREAAQPAFREARREFRQTRRAMTPSELSAARGTMRPPRITDFIQPTGGVT